MANVLAVGPPEVTSLVERALRADGHEVCCAAQPATHGEWRTFKRQLRGWSPDVIFWDLPSHHGPLLYQVLEDSIARAPRCVLLVSQGWPTEPLPRMLARAHVLRKPLTAAALRRAAQNAEAISCMERGPRARPE